MHFICRQLKLWAWFQVNFEFSFPRFLMQKPAHGKYKQDMMRFKHIYIYIYSQWWSGQLAVYCAGRAMRGNIRLVCWGFVAAPLAAALLAK